MSSTQVLCQRALHLMSLESLTGWWRRRHPAPESDCPLKFSRRNRQRVTWSRFVCGIGTSSDILRRKERRP